MDGDGLTVLLVLWAIGTASIAAGVYLLSGLGPALVAFGVSTLLPIVLIR
jgi:hypothetical protein